VNSNMPTIANTNSYSVIKAAYSSSLPSGRDAYKKSSVANLSSPAYSVEISGKGKQQSQTDLNIDRNREHAEFERGQNQSAFKFQRKKQAEEQEFNRNQRQDEIYFKQKLQQQEAEFNRNLKQEETSFERKQQQEAAKLVTDKFSIVEAS